MPLSPVRSAPSPLSDEISILDILLPLMRRWRLMLLVPLCCGVAAGAVSYLIAPKYTAVTTLSEESSPASALSGNLATLAGLAGQFGVGMGTGGNLTPDFLAVVLKSRELLEATLTSNFTDPHRPSEQRPLLNLLHVKGKTQREIMSNGVQRLTGITKPSIDRKTGIVTLTVELHDPELAAAVANRMVELLDRFNVEQRQTQSRQEREFVAGRLAQAERELHAAEQKQVRFLQTNRQYDLSPLLKFEADSLSRAVQLKQEVFLSLTKAYEDARIAEVRDTPSITVIDTAVPPARRSSPRRLLMVLVGLFIGGLVAIAVTYSMDFARWARHPDQPGPQAPAEAWTQARGEMAASFGKLEK